MAVQKLPIWYASLIAEHLPQRNTLRRFYVKRLIDILDSLAGILPEALRTKCARCSPIQKENALKIITRLYYDYPDQYRALRERWDPSGEYHRRFEEYLRGLQFNQIGGSSSSTGNGGTGVGNTIESGGNDRPVRNDLDRQPASTQSSNVQPIVIDPTLAGQPVPTPPPPPSPQLPLAVAPATERPRPPAPVAQILFPTTTDTTITTTIISTTTSTTTSTSTSNSGPVELTGDAPSASVPTNTVTISSSVLSSSSSAGTDERPSGLPGLLDTERDSLATAVVPVPVNYYLNITNGGSLTLWLVHVTLGDDTTTQ
uniref:Chemosensory protein 5 n=1 Tax=Anopheles maculatus TaxID=74869 RepID=A0A182S7Z0_9DIPT